jgi:tetratricopeptide (TPR) repeat protein
VTAESDELWRVVGALLPDGPPPCARIARKTGIADATVSDWFRKRHVPAWPRFQQFLGYFPAAEHPRLEAAWRAAWAARQHEPAAPPTPQVSLLPYDIADFTGRRREVEELDRLLAGDDGTGLTLVAIQGMAGTGKTRLAVHVLRRAGARLGDVQLYADLGGFAPGREPAHPAAVLGALLRHLGGPDGELPPDLEDRAALYRHRLEGRRAVVLLDDAAGPEQVRPLLPGSGSCRVVVTSRRALDGLDGCRPLPLGTFDEPDARDLLARIVGPDRVAAEPAAADRIVALTGRLPLAVSLAARRLRARPAWRVADLAERLEAEGDRLTQLAASDVAVRAAFDLSYGQLAEPHRRLFRRLAAHPGRDFCAHSAAAVASVPAAEAAVALETLLDEHLLESAAPGRYGPHALLALFARERFAAEEDADARATAVRRGLEWYLRTAERADRLVQPHRRRLPLDPLDPPVESCPLAAPADSHAWYERERPAILAATRVAAAAGHDDVAWKLPIVLFSFYKARQGYRELRGLLESAQAAAERAADPVGVAWVHNARGVGEGMLGNHPEARWQFERAAAGYRALGDPEGEGTALNNLGETFRRDGDFATALAFYRQDLALSRARGDTAATGVGLDNIGKAEFGLGRLAAATAAYTEALQVARAAGDRHTEAEVLHDLGEVTAAAGDPAAAVGHYRASARLCEELGDLAAAAGALVGAAETAGDPADAAAALALLPAIDEPFAGRLRERLAAGPAGAPAGGDGAPGRGEVMVMRNVVVVFRMSW